MLLLMVLHFWKVIQLLIRRFEVFITVDEEIGLLGAVGFDCSVLKGRRFINLDSEAEGSLWISCAGGLSGVSHIPVTRLDAEGEKLTVKISGLMGGHSGAEIDKNRAKRKFSSRKISPWSG